MIPKEKAVELYKKFLSTTDFKIKPNQPLDKCKAKMISKMCVDEILIACNQVYDSDIVHFKETGMGDWWLKVKSEIEKL